MDTYSNNDLLSVLNTIEDAIVVYDSNGGLSFWNNRFQELYSYKDEDLFQGQHYSRLGEIDIANGNVVVGDEFGTGDDYLKRKKEYRSKLKGTFTVQLKDGRWIKTTDRAMPSGGFVSVQSDVTAFYNLQTRLEKQVAAEVEFRDQIQDQRQQLDNILNSARSTIYGLDLDGRIVFANDQATQYLQLPPDLPAHWPSDLTLRDHHSGLLLEGANSPLRRALSGETIKGDVFRLHRAELDSTRYIRLTCAPIATPMRNGPVTILFFDDITEQEHTRLQLERKSRLDALGQLTGGISHEFNNLLTTIHYAMILAAEETDPKERKAVLDLAASSVARGSDLTKRLLAFAKSQPGQAVSFSLAEFMVDFEKLVRPTIEKYISLSFILEADDLWVQCDATQLQNALLNLILNSRDAIIGYKTGGHISVRVTANPSMIPVLSHNMPASKLTEDHSPAQTSATDDCRNEYLGFVVEDDGPGMSDEVRRRATDPFFTTKEPNSGTGLGLSMVYGFVEQSAGEMRLSSNGKQGTSVELLLPRGQPTAPHKAVQPTQSQDTGTGQTVLVVEDEEDLCILTERMLRTLGYHAISARSGADALDILNTTKGIQLVLTDIMMPGGMDGFQLAKRIRAQTPDLPLIYMTGGLNHPVKGIGDEEKLILRKPIRPKVLADSIRNALQAS